MALFGSIKVAPGVRVSASPRGLRGHVGPRLARLHVGGGRTGVSTGAGPLTLYGNAGSARRGFKPTSTSGMTEKQAQKARQCDEVRAAWLDLDSLHRTTFPMATQPPPVRGEPVPMFAVLMRQAERECLAGIGRRDRDARKRARIQARELAESRALHLLEAGMRDRDARQSASDQQWARLVDGEPEALEAEVGRALSARGLEVVVTSTERGHLDLDLVVPGDDELPTHWPTTTSTGQPSLKKLNKTEVAQQHRHLVAARVLLGVKESFAQSANLRSVTISGRLRGDKPVVRASISREAIQGASFERDAWSVLTTCDPDFEASIGGRTNELRPLK